MTQVVCRIDDVFGDAMIVRFETHEDGSIDTDCFDPIGYEDENGMVHEQNLEIVKKNMIENLIIHFRKFDNPAVCCEVIDY